MNKRNQIALFIVSISLAAVLGIILSWTFIINASTPHYPFDIPHEFLPAITLFVTLKTVVSFVNMALILLTLAIYVDIYKRIKSKFTAGLILMIVVLLMHALTSNPLLQFRFGYQVIGLGPLSIIPDLFTTIALTVLFYLSLE
jgi:hypothetical protein